MPNTRVIQEGLYLSFDFGMCNIGTAMGNTLTLSAEPLKSISAQKGHPDWQRIDALIQEWQPIGLIVGHPLNIDGSKQKITLKAEGFTKHLKQKYPKIAVYSVDERCSTVEAKSQLFDLEGYSALTKENVDNYSAKVICENFLTSAEILADE